MNSGRDDLVPNQEVASHMPTSALASGCSTQTALTTSAKPRGTRDISQAY